MAWPSSYLVRLARWQGNSIASVQIHSQNQPARARDVLNTVGFQLPEIGRLRPFEVGTADAAIGIEALAAGAALTCTFALPSSTPRGEATENETA